MTPTIDRLRDLGFEPIYNPPLDEIEWIMRHEQARIDVGQWASGLWFVGACMGHCLFEAALEALRRSHKPMLDALDDAQVDNNFDAITAAAYVHRTHIATLAEMLMLDRVNQ